MYTSFHAIFTCLICVAVIVKKYKNRYSDLSINIPVWVILIFSGGMFFCLFAFGLYHCSLLCRGRTTNEEMRGKYKRYGGNPFNKGVGKNCKIAWSYKQSRILDENAITDPE